jgi:hypothetical protein
VCREKQIRWEAELQHKKPATEDVPVPQRRRLEGKQPPPQQLPQLPPQPDVEMQKPDEEMQRSGEKRARQGSAQQREKLEAQKKEELRRPTAEKRHREESEFERRLLEEEKQIGERISFVQTQEPWTDPETGKALDAARVKLGQDTERASFERSTESSSASLELSTCKCCALGSAASSFAVAGRFG